ncbi:alkaline phosphatase D family protein [Variovorax dokdonensis]|uniref:Alkaline phosphatase D family protein n=1 Tax=Variovorax dokdonensis TaxID=344883 RepID=A0ABT7NFV1_9BURK|nr:alkaline phosphatase D family protein [Variovorax dokdonensis]MDM0046700.1 alkaline phosphatase D family protein [Variovorax dokdonensis]
MSTILLRRRDLHRAALGLALSAWGLPAASASGAPGPRWRLDPFSLGVASGMPRPDSVVLWTRLAPPGEDAAERDARPPVRVRWEVFADESLRRRVAHGEQDTDADRVFSVHAAVTGLAPARQYWYRFSCGDAQSPVGRTRTAPAADAAVDRLRLALGACQHYEQGFYAAHREIARRDLDAVLFVGDYIYEGHVGAARAVRRHEAGEPRTLDEYRARHAHYKRDADLQASHAAHPWILTWDDHEVVNDYAADREPEPTDAATFLQRRAAAYRAYFEHMPVALGPTGAQMRIHDRFGWGRLADLWTMDCRQHRSHHACADPRRDHGRQVIGCAELDDPARTMLGLAQERWLGDGLAGSGARWKLLAQSTQLSSIGIDTPQGRQFWTDGWDGYPAARQRLMDGIAQAEVRDVVVLGGDVHRFVAADLRARPNDPASPVLASEIVGGSITSRGAGLEDMSRLRQSNPDLHHARGDQRGYTLLDIGPAQMRCEFRATAHPAAEDAALSAQASFVIEAGRPGPQAA